MSVDRLGLYSFDVPPPVPVDGEQPPTDFDG